MSIADDGSAGQLDGVPFQSSDNAYICAISVDVGEKIEQNLSRVWYFILRRTIIGISTEKQLPNNSRPV